MAQQHLFVSPDGKVISSVAYFVTKGELEWMWVDAIRELNPAFAWEATGRSRAPEKYRKGDADKTRLDKKRPTEREVQRALKDIRRLGGRGGRGGCGGRAKILQAAQKNSRIIIRSDDKRALDWGQNTLRGYKQFRNGLIRDIGRVSPKPWAKTIEEWLADRSESTRNGTAIALERLANPKSVDALRRATKNRREENDILGRMLRALAACGPEKSAVVATVARAAKSHKEATVRANAMVGVGKLESREAVTTSLRAGLQDVDPLVRTVTAYVISIRQDRALLDHLIASMQAETDPGSGLARLRKAAEEFLDGKPKNAGGAKKKGGDNKRHAGVDGGGKNAKK